MRVGWLQDYPRYEGGGEITGRLFREAAPEGVKVLSTSGGDVPDSCDVYVVQNCTQYTFKDYLPMAGKPVVKYVHDLWPSGDTALREIILDQAHLIFTSQPHREWFTAQYGPSPNPTHVVVPPLEDDFFQPLDTVVSNGTCWIGRYFEGKGIRQAVRWAQENQTPVDFYGMGPDAHLIDTDLTENKGLVKHTDMKSLMASYSRLIFFPDWLEPFGRVVAEAKVLGLEVLTNKNCGAGHWAAQPDCMDSIRKSQKDFWNTVLSVAS